MSGDCKRDIEEVFTEAVQLPKEERIAFLERACAGDEGLRRTILALLEVNERAGDFLEPPPTGLPSEGRAKGTAGEKPGDRVGRYKLLQQIGEGGCGIVFVAEQEEPLRRLVALKVVKPGMDTNSVMARFEAERQALALMDHPNIAHVFDAGATESGRPYFVMELVRGVKITEYCDQHNLTTAARLDLFIQVCHAVQHAHQKGIIHRDIKPSNVLVTTSDAGRPLPVVIDFGIAKATTGQRLTDKTVFTALEMLIGTPAYMSPEQAELTSADVDTRSDIYSLGVLLYELLTGTTPFDSRELLKAGLDEFRRVIREQEPVRPSTRLSTMIRAELTGVCRHRAAEPARLIREVRGDLDWVVMTALEKERARRYQTANALAEDIQRYLENETVSARPPSRLYQFQKLVSRHKLEFAAFGLILTTLVAGLSVTTWSLAREKQAHLDADVARHDADIQRNKAQIGEQNALTEAARSEAVTRFLKRMFQGNDPSIALGHEATALPDSLDDAVKRLGRELTNQPAVQADLRVTIGQVYGSLGRYDKAELLTREALDFYRKSPAGAEQRFADALSILALLHQRNAKWEEAEQLGREALALETSLSSEPNMRRLTRETQLAWTIVDRGGRTAEAEELLRQALATGQRLVGEESLELVDTRAALATALHRQDKLDEAEKLFRENLSLRQKKLTADHPLVGYDLHRLAYVLERKGKLDEAETFNRQALAIRRKMLGVEHPLFDESQTALVRVLSKRGKATEAADAGGELLAIRRKRFGDHDPRVQETITVLAELIVDSHNEARFEQLAKEFPWCWLTRSEYAARKGRWSEARAAASKFLEIQPGDYLGYQFLALLLVQMRERAAYEEVCAQITTRFAGTTHALTAHRLANACLLLPRPAADLKVASEFAATAIAGGQKDPALHFFQCGKALAEYREGHWEAALDWAQRAAEAPSPYARAEAYAILAMAQHGSKQTEASRRSLQKCVEVVQTNFPKLEAGELGRNWRDWIIAHALLIEAKNQIEGLH